MKDTIQIVECPKCGRSVPAQASQGVCPQCALAAVAAPTEADQPGGTEPPPPSLKAVAAAFPQLEILGLIGTGGMGCVYKARQPKLDRLVALKLLTQNLANDTAFTGRFHREARLLARLNHPGIVSVYDYGESGGFFFLLMEFVDGVNLRQAMRVNRFTPAQALELVPKICEALQFAHDEGVLHRDIKPENILLDARGRVKIADFGIAKLIGEKSKGATLTASGVAIGTPHYMAPEQLEHPQDVDQRADIYSLGVVFYEMLTGELPIGRFAPPSQKTPMDPRVDHVVLQALEKERERRQHNVTEVKTEVEQITAAPHAEAKPKTTTLKTSPCCVSTPEYLRTLRGRFFSIYQGKGELCLSAGTLRFNSGWQVVTIPLERITALALGEYPISARIAPLHYLEVNFNEHGAVRTLLFTPMKNAFQPGSRANALVDDWLAELQKAVRATTGKALDVGRSMATPAHAARELLKTFLLASLLCALIFALLPVVLEHRAPDRLADYLPGPIVVGSAVVMLLGIRWWRYRFGGLTESEPAAPLKVWERWWLRRPGQIRKWVRGGFAVATLVAASRFLTYSLEYEEQDGQFSRHWTVGIPHPWLRTGPPKAGAGFTSGIEFNAGSDSFAAGVAALLLGWVTARLYRVEKSSFTFATQSTNKSGMEPGEAGAGSVGSPAFSKESAAAVRNDPKASDQGLVRQAPCYFSTPERMRDCFPAPQAHIFQCKGQLRLEAGELVFVSPWQTRVVIPLKDIRDLSIGQFQMWTTPWVMKYARVNFLSITAINPLRTVHLTPVPAGINSTEQANSQVAEWFETIRAAVVALTGAAPHASEPAAVTVSAQPGWTRKGGPLFAGFLLSDALFVWLATTRAPGFVLIPVVIVMLLLLMACLWYTGGYLSANLAIKRGAFDAVTSEDPPGESSGSKGPDDSVTDKRQRPPFWTFSGWMFLGIGIIALIDTLAMFYRQPFVFTFYPGWAHLFAGVALLTLNRRWRIVALVALSISVLLGAYVTVDMARFPQHASVVPLPFMMTKPVSVVDHPYVGAAIGLFLALMLLWPCLLLLNHKAKELFRIAPST